jgi:xanthine dehydrogenase accessory factor
MGRATLGSLRVGSADKRPVTLGSDLEEGSEELVDGGEAVAGTLMLSAVALHAVETAIRHDRSGRLAEPNDHLFVQVFNTPLRLILVGAVHIAQALAPMAEIAGYDVTIVDPRRAFASDSRFPSVTLRSDWPDEAMRDLAPDHRTAVVTLTHDPKLDDPALQAALDSDAFYIGALGSTRTHARRLERLAEAGVPDDKLRRIHGPLGLPLGGRSPAEIAIATLAQMTQVLHGAPPLEKRPPEPRAATG